MTKAPLIGITAYREENNNPVKISLNEAYIQAIEQSGAIPILIPPNLTDKHLAALLPRLDGVLFSGGGDLAPEWFGASWHASIQQVDRERDRMELQLTRQVVSTGVPFLGICRGLQVINVALGGSLYTDLADGLPGSIRHDYDSRTQRDLLAHSVRVDIKSRLGEVFQVAQLSVNSLHHQGIEKLAAGLRAVAFAPDGLAEAIELPDHPFGLAVQWHPECLLSQAPMRQLFAAFTQAAERKRLMT